MNLSNETWIILFSRTPPSIPWPHVTMSETPPASAAPLWARPWTVTSDLCVKGSSRRWDKSVPTAGWTEEHQPASTTWHTSVQQDKMLEPCGVRTSLFCKSWELKNVSVHVSLSTFLLCWWSHYWTEKGNVKTTNLCHVVSIDLNLKMCSSPVCNPPPLWGLLVEGRVEPLPSVSSKMSEDTLCVCVRFSDMPIQQTSVWYKAVLSPLKVKLCWI